MQRWMSLHRNMRNIMDDCAATGRENVNVYTGSYVVCKQQGDIAFINEETEEKETLRNVLDLPEAMMNIISEGELTKQNPGHWFLTTGKKRLFGKPGRLPIDLTRSCNRGAMKIRPMPLNTSWTPHSNYEIQCYVTVNGCGNSLDKITPPSFTDFFTNTPINDKISEQIVLIQNWNSENSMNGTDEIHEIEGTRNNIEEKRNVHESS